jgi:hypothetical protein
MSRTTSDTFFNLLRNLPRSIRHPQITIRRRSYGASSCLLWRGYKDLAPTEPPTQFGEQKPSRFARMR